MDHGGGHRSYLSLLSYLIWPLAPFHLSMLIILNLSSSTNKINEKPITIHCKFKRVIQGILLAQ
jgi:hypothetical protein